MHPIIHDIHAASHKTGVSPCSIFRTAGLTAPNYTYWRNGASPKASSLKKMRRVLRKMHNPSDERTRAIVQNIEGTHKKTGISHNAIILGAGFRSAANWTHWRWGYNNISKRNAERIERHLSSLFYLRTLFRYVTNY